MCSAGSTKQCTKCGEIKPLELFSVSRKHSTGHASACKACQSKRAAARYARDSAAILAGNAEWSRLNRVRHLALARAWCARNPDKVRAKNRKRHLRVNYGLTVGEYDTMLAAQGGVCAICLRPPNGRRLAVDHCHATGAVRGLLHGTCNAGLGQFNDDPAKMRQAADYVERHSGGTTQPGTQTACRDSGQDRAQTH